MSDEVLSPETPDAPAAAQAPAPATAAADGSVDSPSVTPTEKAPVKTVDADRFNGLMSTYQTEKTAWEAERESMRAELERLEKQAEPEPSSMSDDALTELRALRAELAAEKLATARAQAVAEFPGSAPLADLIVGETPDAIRSMAQELHERLTGLTTPAADAPAPAATDSPTDAPAPAAAAAPPAAPTHGGAVPVSDVPDLGAVRAEAVAARDFGAWWNAVLQEGTDAPVG
ncbi:MAG: hypothetical protein ACXVGB_00320 [Mycobacteriaceae bacterium]